MILVITGLITNVTVGTASIMQGDDILTIICCIIFTFTALGYYLYSQTKFENVGIHCMLGIYFTTFTWAIKTHLVYYPLLMVYAVIIGLSGVLFRRYEPRVFYTFIGMLGSIFYIIEMNNRVGFIDNRLNLFISCAITCGMLVGLFFVTHIHENKIQKFQNILESKEKHLSEKNIELEKYIDSNLQLENFAYLASHELKTPMRNITNFAGLLMMKMKNNIDPANEERMLYIKNEVDRMNGLIADLLELSQMSNENFDFSHFNPRPMLEQIITEKFSNHSNHIFIKSLPDEIYGNQELIIHLLQNLIQNAIKFNIPDTDPKVEILGYKEANFKHFEIRDFGIGIDDDYKEQIFLIFKRLHNQSDIKGNGIGLSLCKKIVERHNGKIWITDNYSTGSVFHFTIRDAEYSVS